MNIKLLYGLGMHSLVLVFLTVLNTGCKKDWLDQKTDLALTVPSSLKDLQALMDNVNLINSRSPSLGEISCDDRYILDSRFQSSSIFQLEKNTYTWSNTFFTKDVLDWNNSYNNIYYCNTVLDALNKFKSVPSEQQEWNNLKGQALFHRSRIFYEMAQIYIPAYQSATANTDLGLPLRLESDLNLISKRSTVQETYDKILNDLFVAFELLPNVTQYKTRPTKNTINALLARIYLSMEIYDKAAKYADDCLRQNNSLLQYSTISTTPTNPMPRGNIEVVYQNTMINYSNTMNNALVDQLLYLLYDTDDLRRLLFFRSNADGSKSFRGNYTQSSTPFNGLANNEMYLIRAECSARLGDKESAMKDLNDLLVTRWAKNPDGTSKYIYQTALDSEDALKKVLVERRKELLVRGLRWSDLRRLNRDPRFAKTIIRNVLGTTYTLEPGSYKYTLPIPDDVIQLSRMPQNLNWTR